LSIKIDWFLLTFASGSDRRPETGVEALASRISDQHVSLRTGVSDGLANTVVAASDCCVELAVGTTAGGRLCKLEQVKTHKYFLVRYLKLIFVG